MKMNKLQQTFKQAIAMGVPSEVFMQVADEFQKERDRIQAERDALPWYRLWKKMDLGVKLEVYGQGIDEAKLAAKEATSSGLQGQLLA